MKRILAVAAEVFALCLLLMPERALESVRAAAEVWGASVAPSLFPFLAVLPLLTCPEACRGYERLLGGGIRRALGLPGGMAPAMLIGMAAGSPAGALAAVRAARACGASVGELKRAALAFTGLSPVFLVAGVGVALYGDRAVGLALARAQLLSQWICALCLRGLWREERQIVPAAARSARAEHPVREAALCVLQIGGTMALFSVAAGFVAAALGDAGGAAALAALDFPSGAAVVAAADAPLAARVAVTGAMLGFGGCCIAAQNMAALAPAGVRLREYIGVKAFSASLCALLARLLCPKEAVFAFSASGGAPMSAVSSLFAAVFALPALAIFAENLFLNNARER